MAISIKRIGTATVALSFTEEVLSKLDVVGAV
jgi:hypothetical protein